MRILVDSNVLLRIAQPSHQHCQAAIQTVRALLQNKESLFIVPQVLYEFWVVATRPFSTNGLEMTCVEASESIRKSKEIFELLLDEPEIYRLWEHLVSAHQIRGKKAHDAHLVSAMINHNIDRILTFNEKDFASFSQIRTFVPGRLDSI